MTGHQDGLKQGCGAGRKQQKFGYPSTVVRTILNEILAISDLVISTTIVNVVETDPDDNRILECALESRAACVVTGDKHLLGLGQFQGTRILNVSAFLAEY